mgnify:CR=1 FL=1
MSEKKTEGLSIVEQPENKVCKIKFEKPVMYDGVEINELEFDFNKATVDLALKVESEMKSEAKILSSTLFDTDFQLRIAFRVCKQPVGMDILKYIPLSEFGKIRTDLRNFF